jgi:hypothetical protein
MKKHHPLVVDVLKCCFYFVLVAFVANVVGSLLQGCSSAIPRIDRPSEVCASALDLSPEVQEQARKVSIEPIELAREVCETALLAAKLGAP